MKSKNEILEYLKKEQIEKTEFIRSTRKSWIENMQENGSFVLENLKLSIEPNSDRQCMLNDNIQKYRQIIESNQQEIRYIDSLIRQIN
tara:strand:- start:356 stop:619 length:264 start_codon:yes stop_codon:yes gene_type:complete